MDLLESNDFLDNSCIFKNENPLREFRSTRDGESGHRVGWGGESDGVEQVVNRSVGV